MTTYHSPCSGEEHSLYVGNLSAEVDSLELLVRMEHGTCFVYGMSATQLVCRHCRAMGYRAGNQDRTVRVTLCGKY